MTKKKSSQPLLTMPQMTLAESLARFATSITSASTLSVKYDLVKQQVAVQERKEERLQKFKYSLDFFDEEDNYKLEALNKSSNLLKRQIDLNLNSQADIASKLVANIERDRAIPHNVDKSDTADEVNAVKKELAILKDEFTDNKAQLQKLEEDHLTKVDLKQSDFDKALDTLVTQVDLQHHTELAEQQMQQVTATVQDCNQAMKSLDHHLVQRLNGLSIRFDEAEDSLRENLKDQCDFLVSDIKRLEERANKADESYQRNIKEHESTLHRLLEFETSLRQYAERFESALHQLSIRAVALETMSEAQQQKFDGLTTDHLLTKMIQHFQRMYPDMPANAVARVSEINANLHHFERIVASFNYRISQAERQQNGLNKVCQERIEKFGETTQSVSKQLEVLRSESNVAFEKHSTAVAAVRADIALLAQKPNVTASSMEELKTGQSALLASADLD